LAKGALAIRVNVADRKEWALVPGELVVEYHPTYFDPRHDPPDIQRIEKLYYTPCSNCGRASNDPKCRCASDPLVSTVIQNRVIPGKGAV
jgi:molecular chaperone DnaK